jgi:hypothetical protein
MAEAELGHAVRIEELVRSPRARRKQRDWHMEPNGINQDGVGTAKVVRRHVRARREVEVRRPDDSASCEDDPALVLEHDPCRVKSRGLFCERACTDALLDEQHQGKDRGRGSDADGQAARNV